ncbi:TPA: oligosaccharide flippase family protein [Legionella pneumophila]
MSFFYKNKLLELVTPIASPTINRLLFFGGRYLSQLAIAKYLQQNAAAYLIAIVVVEFFRIFFDYGLENSILSLVDQQPGKEAEILSRGKGITRIFVILVGQCITTLTITLLCIWHDFPLTIPLLCSLQFTCLMGFGYLQVHMQVQHNSKIGLLNLFLMLLLFTQSILIGLLYINFIPTYVCILSFETFALIISLIILRHKMRPNLLTDNGNLKLIYKVLCTISPLGNVALISIAYTRIDAFIVTCIANTNLLTQYMIYQRLASILLMFFSAISMSSIPTLSSVNNYSKLKVRKLAFLAALISVILLMISTPWVSLLFVIESVDFNLICLQSLALGFQIFNGFNVALLIASKNAKKLWAISRNNTMTALLLLPVGVMYSGVTGFVIAMIVIEIYCTWQHLRAGKQSREMLHAH